MAIDNTTTVLTAAKQQRAEAQIAVDGFGNPIGTPDNPFITSETDASEVPMSIVRPAAEPTTLEPGAAEAQNAVNGRRDQLVVVALGDMAEQTRLGNTWSLAIPTANAFNFVAAWPTTRAEIVLFNGEPAGGKSYVLDSAWVTTIVSPAASAALTLIGQLVPSGAAPTDNTAVLITSRSGRPNYGGRAMKAIANTAYAIASKWEVLGTNIGGAGSVQIGTSVIAWPDGGWIVPPGGLLLLNAVSGTVATAAGLIGCTWHEVNLPVA